MHQLHFCISLFVKCARQSNRLLQAKKNTMKRSRKKIFFDKMKLKTSGSCSVAKFLCTLRVCELKTSRCFNIDKYYCPLSINCTLETYCTRSSVSFSSSCGLLDFTIFRVRFCILIHLNICFLCYGICALSCCQYTAILMLSIYRFSSGFLFATA